MPLPDVTIADGDAGASYITLSLSGSIKSFEELALGKDNYRAKVWFTNLQHDDGVTSADVLRIEIVKVK